MAVGSNVFSDQCYELLFRPCKAWLDHTCFFTGKKVHPLTLKVRHGSLHGPVSTWSNLYVVRSLHGPIKINVSESGPFAVFGSVHLESSTIYLYFLDFCRSRVSIRFRTNEIALLLAGGEKRKTKCKIFQELDDVKVIIREADSQTSFREALKTHLFQQSF